MSRRSVFVAFARSGCVAAAVLAVSAGAAAAGPHVVTGIDEREAARLFGAAPQPSQPAPVPTQVAYSNGGYGGGFIELLVTGGDPRPAPREAQPRQRVAAYAPAQDANVQRQIDPVFLRTQVDYQGGERPGTIVIDSSNKFLYYVLGRGQALRYGVGVGRPGFVWSGVKTVSRKAQWPDWTPPREMLARRPDLPRHMVGGPANPLGARALYLGSSLYRIHGTNEPYTIGQNVSSGCIRMMNDDVADLYERVHVGTRVVVR